MFNVGPTELLVILLVALLVVGPKRLPEVGRSIGKALGEFRRTTEEVRSTFEASLDDEPSPNGELPPANTAEPDEMPVQEIPTREPSAPQGPSGPRDERPDAAAGSPPVDQG